MRRAFAIQPQRKTDLFLHQLRRAHHIHNIGASSGMARSLFR
jgi:hypothetical protein